MTAATAHGSAPPTSLHAFGCCLGSPKKALNHLIVKREGRRHRFVHHDDFKHLAVVLKQASMFDGWALAEKQILPPVRRRDDCQQSQPLGVDAYAGLLANLPRSGFLPCLAAHLVAAGQRKIAIPVFDAPADHQKTSSDRHEYNHDGGRVVIVAHDQTPQGATFPSRSKRDGISRHCDIASVHTDASAKHKPERFRWRPRQTISVHDPHIDLT